VEGKRGESIAEFRKNLDRSFAKKGRKGLGERAVKKKGGGEDPRSCWEGKVKGVKKRGKTLLSPRTMAKESRGGDDHRLEPNSRGGRH